jgi:hypothetical protein
MGGWDRGDFKLRAGIPVPPGSGYFFKTPAAGAIPEAVPVQAWGVMEIPNLSD